MYVLRYLGGNGTTIPRRVFSDAVDEQRFLELIGSKVAVK